MRSWTEQRRCRACKLGLAEHQARVRGRESERRAAYVAAQEAERAEVHARLSGVMAMAESMFPPTVSEDVPN